MPTAMVRVGQCHRCTAPTTPHCAHTDHPRHRCHHVSAGTQHYIPQHYTVHTLTTLGIDVIMFPQELLQGVVKFLQHTQEIIRGLRLMDQVAQNIAAPAQPPQLQQYSPFSKAVTGGGNATNPSHRYICQAMHGAVYQAVTEARQHSTPALTHPEFDYFQFVMAIMPEPIDPRGELQRSAVKASLFDQRVGHRCGFYVELCAALRRGYLLVPHPGVTRDAMLQALGLKPHSLTDQALQEALRAFPWLHKSNQDSRDAKAGYSKVQGQAAAKYRNIPDGTRAVLANVSVHDIKQRLQAVTEANSVLVEFDPGLFLSPPFTELPQRQLDFFQRIQVINAERRLLFSTNEHEHEQAHAADERVSSAPAETAGREASGAGNTEVLCIYIYVYTYI